MEFLLDVLLLAQPAAGQRPDIGVGRIHASPPTSRSLARFPARRQMQLCEDRNAREPMQRRMGKTTMLPLSATIFALQYVAIGPEPPRQSRDGATAFGGEAAAPPVMGSCS